MFSLYFIYFNVFPIAQNGPKTSQNIPNHPEIIRNQTNRVVHPCALCRWSCDTWQPHRAPRNSASTAPRSESRASEENDGDDMGRFEDDGMLTHMDSCDTHVVSMLCSWYSLCFIVRILLQSYRNVFKKWWKGQWMGFDSITWILHVLDMKGISYVFIYVMRM